MTTPPDPNVLARRCAKMALQVIVTAPVAVQVEASVMLLKAVFMTSVKPAKRLKVFDEYMRLARLEIAADLKEGKTNGRKPADS